MLSNQAYNGQDATVLEASSRPIHEADRSRIAMPNVHTSKSRRGREVPINLTPVQADRFWQFVEEADSGCWEWLGFIDTRHGYGIHPVNGVRVRAHRIAVTLVRGPVPLNLTVDHLCRNRRCVNPDHLEVVPNKENILRGDSPTAINARKTHCKHGHEFTPENTVRYPKQGGKYLSRECLACRRGKQRDEWAQGKRLRGGRPVHYCRVCKKLRRTCRPIIEDVPNRYICSDCSEKAAG